MWCGAKAGEGFHLDFASSSLFRGRAFLGTLALCLALSGFMATPIGFAQANGTLEERKLPMRFSWVDCEPNCRGWVSAVGIVTADSPNDFEEFAHGRDLEGTTVVLDSSGGSVNDSIALGRRFRELSMRTTVGSTLEIHTAKGDRASISSEAYCESMCVFLLLSGKSRFVPETAHVRVHQIWMGDRADDAKAASYTAQDLMIVERDIGRLAKYTYDMGGAGDLLLLSLNVPPWEDLHELSAAELRLTHLVTTERATDVLPQPAGAFASTPVAELSPKPTQDRFTTSAAEAVTAPQVAKSTKTAEAVVPTGSAAPAQ
jgi:hypothetical protein